VLIRKMTADKVLAALHGEGGTVTRNSFDESKKEALEPRWRAPVLPPQRRPRDEKLIRSAGSVFRRKRRVSAHSAPDPSHPCLPLRTAERVGTMSSDQH
jgi:hypothetical protein